MENTWILIGSRIHQGLQGIMRDPVGYGIRFFSLIEAVLSDATDKENSPDRAAVMFFKFCGIPLAKLIMRDNTNVKTIQIKTS